MDVIVSPTTLYGLGVGLVDCNAVHCDQFLD